MGFQIELFLRGEAASARRGRHIGQIMIRITRPWLIARERARVGTLVLVACLATGCTPSPYEFAPVSGVVTLDGKPLDGARVTFMPRPGADGLVAGPDSAGETDAEGRFSLATSDGQPGAVTSTHRVRIKTQKYERVGESAEDFRLVSPERVPARYNKGDTLTAEVPLEGRDDLVFELTSN